MNTRAEALNTISSGELADPKKSFELIQYCSRGLRTPETETSSRDLIIRVLDVWERIASETLPIWNDLVESAGLYPYVKSELITGAARLRFEAHRSRFLKNTYLHSEQQDLSIQLLSDNSAIVSAPTSFGKSLLIEEIVASEKYSNIVIIQPTLALLDETRKKLQKYGDQYQLLLSTEQQPISKKRHLWLFTAERTVEYEHFSEIDFFVIDEFYKLSMDRDDDRAIALNQALYRLLKFTKRFYFLGPSIKSIPSDLDGKLTFQWFHSRFSTVALNEHVVATPTRLKKDEDKKPHLFKLLLRQREPTIIYCSSPEKATSLALEFISHVTDEAKPTLNSTAKEMIQWIKENIHQNWSLAKAIECGIAFHHGALPRHLSSSIVDLFNSAHVRFLFCTSTLIEGVNTSAKAVILFNRHKGKKPIDYFDYRNIVGRSGRMKRHFIGEVWRFEPVPEELDLDVDIPVLTQDNAPLELLIQIDRGELTEKSQKRMEKFSALPADVQSLLKSNGSVSIEGQLALLKELELRTAELHPIMKWKSFPTYAQLLPVIALAWKHLLNPNESKAGIRTVEHLTMMTIKYCRFQSLKRLIEDSVADPFWILREPALQARVDKISFQMLSAGRHWFDYKLPKLLRTVSELQRFVFEKQGRSSGDYSHLATQLENAFLPSNLHLLCEYDIPISAARKIGKALPFNFDPNNVIASLRRIDFSKISLLAYERKKIDELLRGT